jgi:hypothetical protein
MDEDNGWIIGALLVVGVLCAIGYFVYAYWAAIVTVAIVLISIASSGAAIIHGTRYWLSVEYVSPIVKYVKAGKYDRALALSDRMKPHRFAILERNEEQQLRSALNKLLDKNNAMAANIDRWSSQIKTDMRSGGGIDERLKVAKENPQSEEFKKRLLSELARMHGMKIT